MRKKYLSIAFALTLVTSFVPVKGGVISPKLVKANEVTREYEIRKDLIYSEENYKNEFALDRVIVCVKKDSEDVCAESVFDGIDMADVRQFANCKTPGMVGGESDTNPLYLITLSEPGRENVLEAINILKENPDVAYAEPDYVVEPAAYVTKANDPYIGSQVGLKEIDAQLAWNVTTGSKDVTVAVIDTGFDITHPDLVDNIWTNKGEIPGDKIDNDGNGYIDDIHGWNFADNSNDLSKPDAHGTLVSGIIGAKGNNNKGISGVCMDVKMAVLKYGYNTTAQFKSNIVSALQYAHAMGIDITNNSYRLYSYSQAERDALALGGLHICAAGNESKDIDTTKTYPACYDLPNIISVAATDKNDVFADKMSNYGATTVDLAAPGDGIYSTIPNGGYDCNGGTSLSAPFVTGTAALIKSYYPNYTPAQIKSSILYGVDRLPSLKGKTVTGGRLNVAKALGKVTSYLGKQYKDVYAFDTYIRLYGDVYNQYGDNGVAVLKNFVEVGMAEGRQGSNKFEPHAYADRYKDLKNKYGTNWKQYYLHFINTGKAEGRVGKVDFKPGDFNGDGKWTDADVTAMSDALRSYTLGQQQGKRSYVAAGDMDFDMDIDSADYNDLKTRVANLKKTVTLVGDVNKDGIVSAGDIVAMNKAITNYNANKSTGYVPEADMDRDGDNDQDDALLLKKKLLED